MLFIYTQPSIHDLHICRKGIVFFLISQWNEISFNNFVKRKLIKYEKLIEKSQSAIENLLSDDALTKAFDKTIHTIIQYEMAEDDLQNGNIGRMFERIKRFWIPGSLS